MIAKQTPNFDIPQEFMPKNGYIRLSRWTDLKKYLKSKNMSDADIKKLIPYVYDDKGDAAA